MRVTAVESKRHNSADNGAGDAIMAFSAIVVLGLIMSFASGRLYSAARLWLAGEPETAVVSRVTLRLPTTEDPGGLFVTAAGAVYVWSPMSDTIAVGDTVTILRDPVTHISAAFHHGQAEFPIRDVVFKVMYPPILLIFPLGLATMLLTLGVKNGYGLIVWLVHPVRTHGVPNRGMTPEQWQAFAAAVRQFVWRGTLFTMVIVILLLIMKGLLLVRQFNPTVVGGYFAGVVVITALPYSSILPVTAAAASRSIWVPIAQIAVMLGTLGTIVFKSAKFIRDIQVDQYDTVWALLWDFLSGLIP